MMTYREPRVQLGIRMRIMCLTRNTWKVRNGKALEGQARRRRAVLRLSVHGSTSGVNRSGDDDQVISCHRYLVFHPFVEQLTVFHTSGHVLASSSILRVLNLDLHAMQHRAMAS